MSNPAAPPDALYWRGLEQAQDGEALACAVITGEEWWTRRHPATGAPPWCHAMTLMPTHHTLPVVFDAMREAGLDLGQQLREEDGHGRTIWAYLLCGGTEPTHVRVKNGWLADQLHTHVPRMLNSKAKGVLVQMYADGGPRMNLSMVGRVRLQDSPWVCDSFTWNDWVMGPHEAQERAGHALLQQVMLHMDLSPGASRDLEGALGQLLGTAERPLWVLDIDCAPSMKAAMAILALRRMVQNHGQNVLPTHELSMPLVSAIERAAPRDWWAQLPLPEILRHRDPSLAMALREAQARVEKLVLRDGLVAPGSTVAPRSRL